MYSNYVKPACTHTNESLKKNHYYEIIMQVTINI